MGVSLVSISGWRVFKNKGEGGGRGVSRELKEWRIFVCFYHHGYGPTL